MKLNLHYNCALCLGLQWKRTETSLSIFGVHLVLIHMNGSEVSITATSPPASLPLKGLAA